MTKIYFIDYENIQQIPKIRRTDKILIFVGQNQKTMKIETVSELLKIRNARIININQQGKNNLDFHICFYLGIYHLQKNKKIDFIIVTNDKGFDELIESINRKGRNCKRLSRDKMNENVKINEPDKTNTSVKQKDIAKIDSNKKIVPKKNVEVKEEDKLPDITEIIENENTKIADQMLNADNYRNPDEIINPDKAQIIEGRSSSNKTHKKVDTTKKAKLKKTEDTTNDYEAILNKIKKMTLKLRPKKVKTLLNMINTISPEKYDEKIIKHLEDNNIIKINNTVVTYLI